VALTPLWVISLFLSLTEAVTGIAATQAKGGAQVALTAFVIAFPALVAFAFFAILWHRPFVFYPPAEFGPSVGVADYVNAMTNKVEGVRADVEAEAGNLRVAVSRDIEQFTQRLDVIGQGIAEVLSVRADTTRLSERFEQFRLDAANQDDTRLSFESNSKHRVHVLCASRVAATPAQTAVIGAVAQNLKEHGFKTSTGGGWSTTFFFPEWESSKKPNMLYVLYRDGLAELGVSLRASLMSVEPSAPVELLSIAQIAATTGHTTDMFIREEVDATVAYCLRETSPEKSRPEFASAN
jgi:hypothetical protein